MVAERSTGDAGPVRCPARAEGSVAMTMKAQPNLRLKLTARPVFAQLAGRRAVSLTAVR